MFGPRFGVALGSDQLQAMNSIIRVWPIIAALLGLALIVCLISGSGADDVAHAMLLVGWGLIPITLFHVIPLFLSALSWRDLLPRSNRLDLVSVTWMRWIRESINALLPVGGVGGDVVCARLAHLRGVPHVQAAASMVVDVTIGVATQLSFATTGVVLLLSQSTEPTVRVVGWMVLIGVGMLAAATAVFLFLQHRGIFSASTRLAGGLLGIDRVSSIADSASAIDHAIVRVYHDRLAFCRANLVRLGGWVVGTGEIWLVMQFLGQPIRVIDAFILESLGAGIRAVAFMVPGQLGVLEGSFVVFGALFGLPAGTALAISFCRRVRELALGLPGLCAWQWVEGRHLLRRSRDGLS